MFLAQISNLGMIAFGPVSSNFGLIMLNGTAGCFCNTTMFFSIWEEVLLYSGMAGWPFLSMESKVMIIKRGQAKVIKRVTVWRETCRVIPQGIFLSALVTCAGLALFWNWLPKKKSFSAKCGHIIINVCLKSSKRWRITFLQAAAAVGNTGSQFQTNRSLLSLFKLWSGGHQMQ